jgi:hypothetical protein
VGKVDVKFNEISLCFEELPSQSSQERASASADGGVGRAAAEEGAQDTVQDSVSSSGVRSPARKAATTASVDAQHDYRGASAVADGMIDGSEIPPAENVPSQRVWVPRTVNHRTDMPGASSETKASPTLPGDDSVYEEANQPQKTSHEAEQQQQPAAAPKKYVEKRKWQRKEPVVATLAAEVARLQVPEPAVSAPPEATHELLQIVEPVVTSQSTPAAIDESAQFWQLLHGTSGPEHAGITESISSRTSSWPRGAHTDKYADKTPAQHQAREYKKAENGTPSPTTGAAQSAMRLPEADSQLQQQQDGQKKRWSRNTSVQQEKAPHTKVGQQPSLTPASIETSTAHDAAPLTTKKKKTASDAKVIQKPKSSKTKAARKLAQAEVSDGEPITWPKRETALVVPEPAHLHALAVVEETPALAAEVALKPEHHRGGGDGSVPHGEISASAARAPATEQGYNNAVSQPGSLDISGRELAGAQRYASAVETAAWMEPSEKKYQRGATVTVRKPAKAKTRKVVIKSA